MVARHFGAGGSGARSAPPVDALDLSSVRGVGMIRLAVLAVLGMAYLFAAVLIENHENNRLRDSVAALTERGQQQDRLLRALSQK